MPDHTPPCNDLKKMEADITAMNLKYVEQITGINGSVETIKEFMTNHWNELKEDRKEQRKINEIVIDHKRKFENMDEREKKAHWRIGLIVGVIVSLVSIINTWLMALWNLSHAR